MARKKWRLDDWTWTAQGNLTLWDTLIHKGISAKMIKEIERNKGLFVNGMRLERNTLLAGGEEIRIQMPKEKLDHIPIPMNLSIVYEDEDILVIDKPVGLTVNSPKEPSLANGIGHYFETHKIHRKVRFINRLDRDTSGLIFIAKSAIAQAYYQKELEEGNLEKYYVALVEGHLLGAKTLTLPIRRQEGGLHYEVHPEGKVSQTVYRCVCHIHKDRSIEDVSLAETIPFCQVATILAQELPKGEYTLLAIKLLTGRTHQIRVTLAHEGHPLVGDVLYGAKPQERPFYLRSYKTRFQHMRNQEWIELNLLPAGKE